MTRDQESGPLRFDAVIFDLDGTLVDTLEDLADAVNRVLAARGLPLHGYDDYRFMIGGGMRRLVSDALPADQRAEENVSLCLAEMMADYGEHYLVKTRPYDGVSAMLDALRGEALPLAVLSNKADEFTQRIVTALFGAATFDVVAGARPGVPLKPDPAGALSIGARLGAPPSRIACLGDSGTDMLTATKAGMLALGAAWGFRPEAELWADGAVRVLAHPRELARLRASGT